MRSAWKALLVLTVLAAAAAGPALASVPKVVIAEEFGFAS
jgi:hypothetical protein